MKKSLKVLDGICLVFLFLFALFGTVMSGIILHELSHKKDFQGLVFDDSLCLLAYPGNITVKELFHSCAGYYSFYTKPGNETQVEEIAKYTEVKAYSITIGVVAVFIFCVIIVFYVRLKGREQKNELDDYLRNYKTTSDFTT